MFNRRPLAAPVAKRKRRKPQPSWAGRPSNRAESIAELVTKMKAGESNLLVVSRIRPMADAEVLMGATETAKVVGEKVVVLLDPATDTEDVLRKNRSREKRYAFDHAFSPKATQVEVYENSCKFLLRGVLEGYNATVFAYGPTGAGKTFTMTGSEAHPGVMTRSISDLFRLMAEDATDVNYSVAVNYVEIYNECIRDLLVRSSTDLDLREDSDGNSVVCGVKWVEIESADQMAQLLREGNLRRTQEATRANLASSRSHAILEVRVQRTSRSAGKDHTVHTGRLHMIDLAGSERAASTGNHGQRMVEGQHINRSLLALGNCINALGTGSQKYVNFRDSKLTRILKESLGGNCRTVMIACASPASIHFEETYNTMNYANRAKNIKMAAVKNTTVVEAHIVEFGQIVERLKAEVIFLQAKVKASEAVRGPDDGGAAMSARVQSAERSLTDLARRYDVLFSLEEKLQANAVEEATVTARISAASPSPTRARRTVREARGLMQQEVEAERASIARHIAAIQGSGLEDDVEPRPNLRHLVSKHKLRLAHLTQSTELQILRMRMVAEERASAHVIRDRVIERQRSLLGGTLETIPEDLIEMYRELGELRHRETRHMTPDDGAGAAVVLPHLQSVSRGGSPRAGECARKLRTTSYGSTHTPPHGSDGLASDLEQVLSGDSSSGAESPGGDEEHTRPPSPSALSRTLSSTRSERVDGVSLGSRTVFASPADLAASGDRRPRSISASMVARRALRKRLTLSGRRVDQEVPEDGDVAVHDFVADDFQPVAFDVAVRQQQQLQGSHLGETYSMADFQKLVGGDSSAVLPTPISSCASGLGPPELRRTYSKGALPLPAVPIPIAAVVVAEPVAEHGEAPMAPAALPDFAVLNSAAFRLPSPPKKSAVSARAPSPGRTTVLCRAPSPAKMTAPKRVPRSTRAPFRGKVSQIKSRTQKAPSITPTSFGLNISSSPYAAQPRKPGGRFS